MERGPVYQSDGETRVFDAYSGPLRFDTEGHEETTVGLVRFDLGENPALIVLVPELIGLQAHFSNGFTDLGVPAGANLKPPAMGSTNSKQDSFFPVRVNSLTVGDLGACARFVFHVSGDALPAVFGKDSAGVGRSVRVQLPLWTLDLVAADQNDAGLVFPIAVNAVPTGAFGIQEIQRLSSVLFHSLSFVAGRETGCVPICGLDDDGNVVWADWSAPRHRAGKPLRPWSGDRVADETLDLVLAAFDRWSASDPVFYKIVERAVGGLTAADGGEVLDLRLPMACVGLELLSWGVLQRAGVFTASELEAIRAAGKRFTALLDWCEIPTEIPVEMKALHARVARLGKLGLSGPKVIAGVRNKLVHPPNRIDAAEWPSRDEMTEAWMLSTWYLQLVILRLVGFHGSHWSRVSNFYVKTGVHPVPWSTPLSADARAVSQQTADE